MSSVTRGWPISPKAGPFLYLPALPIAATSQAATFTIGATFDNSWNGGSVVGNGFFSYDASTALADGNYAWSSFTNPKIYIHFSNGSTFTQADFSFDPTLGLGVQILGSQFNFTYNGGYSTPYGGAADFMNAARDTLSTSPNNPGEAWGISWAAYWMDSSSANFGGAYGIGSAANTIPAPGAVPEPSTYGLALGGLALAGAVIRRRSKSSN